ncbi:MAG: GNAT family N-acetyltransferase [Alphaproteobacteria bacterium]
MTGRSAEVTPAGKLRRDVTHLEMLTAGPPAPAAPQPNLSVDLIAAPSVALYRFLYDTVGEPWLWDNRRRMNDAAIEAIIHHPRVAIQVLSVGDQPAGFAELDGRAGGGIQLAYFGILPDFIGQKLGPWLLARVLNEAWAQKPGRVTVNTCTLDHPAALAMYERAGFVPYRRVTEFHPDPRLDGLIPRHAAPHIPLAAS